MKFCNFRSDSKIHFQLIHQIILSCSTHVLWFHDLFWWLNFNFLFTKFSSQVRSRAFIFMNNLLLDYTYFLGSLRSFIHYHTELFSTHWDSSLRFVIYLLFELYMIWNDLNLWNFIVDSLLFHLINASIGNYCLFLFQLLKNFKCWWVTIDIELKLLHLWPMEFF